MAGTLKSVRFISAFKNYRVGDVITPNGTLRDYLVKGGYAVIDDDKPVRTSARLGKAAANLGRAVTRSLV